MSGHGYRYIGKGERYQGVPPRDLTQAFYDSLDPRVQRTVDESGAYKAITAAEAKKAEEEAKKQAEQAATNESEDE